MTASARNRFVALDAFRGIAIAGMILVNTPGSWIHLYPSLSHADWHGFNFADSIFPFFLFAIGSAMAFSFAKHDYSLNSIALRKIGRRALILFLLGLFLHWFPYWDNFDGLRIMGVLQRIAIAYALAALIILSTSERQALAISLFILVGYWLLLVFGGDPPFSLEGNIVRSVDTALLGESHLWQGKSIAFDPEGLLSTLPAVVNVIIGYQAARYLQRAQRSAGMRTVALAGLALIAAALLWHGLLPINKSLWTSSYALMSSGISLLVLALLIVISETRLRRWFVGPLEIYGTNPLFVYALSWLLVRTMSVLILVPNGQGGSISSYDWLFLQLTGVFQPINASLVFALLHVGFFWLVSWLLYRRNIVIKI